MTVAPIELEGGSVTDGANWDELALGTAEERALAVASRHQALESLAMVATE